MKGAVFLYQALYRKWRPQVFSDVSGQPHVTDTLAHEVESGRLSHAYLFTGSRGTGKTSCAKILAKAVNCLSPEKGSPCCECELCKGIDGGSVLDVIEIDAASNNGVDNIRDLREEASFTPVKAKYRVYIVDEVHMLSIGAFNALLKILEEPPPYVIFILATTEAHKLPATILSRCQRFDFKHIPPEDISARLMFVADSEKIQLDKDAALLIARISDGSLRDALSLLDRCSARGVKVTADTVSDCAGIAGHDYLFKMADFVKKGDTSGALALVGGLNSESFSMERLCSELLNHFRNLMISKTVRSAEELIICSNDELAELKEQACSFTLESIFYSLSVLEDTAFNLKRGLDRRIEMEMAVIKLCDASLRCDTSAILKRVSDLESALKTGALSPSPPLSAQPLPKSKASKKSAPSAKAASSGVPDAPVAPDAPDKSDDIFSDDKLAEIPKPAKASVSAPVSVDENSASFPPPLFECWQEVLLTLKRTSAPLAGILLNSEAFQDDDIVLIKSQNAAFEQFLDIQSYYLALEDAIFKTTGKKPRIMPYRDDKDENPTSDPLSRLVSKFDSMAGG